MTHETGPIPLVVQPNEAESYWQPVPANGFVEVHVSRHRHETVTPFESGMQEVAPGCFVREHAHDPHEELILVMAGEGVAMIDDAEHPMRPGTTLYLAPTHKHKFTNTGAGPLRFFWVLLPGGLSDFFRAIGRPRRQGEPVPEPFPRPDNVAQIEADTVYMKLKQNLRHAMDDYQKPPMIDPPPRPVSTQDVPILDMSPLVSGGDIGPLAKTLRSACESMAFFYVKNHGVTHATIEGAIAASKRFFEQPLEVRLMHYPLQEQATDSHSIGATAHTDFGLVTVLY